MLKAVLHKDKSDVVVSTSRSRLVYFILFVYRVPIMDYHQRSLHFSYIVIMDWIHEFSITAKIDSVEKSYNFVFAIAVLCV